MGRKLWESAAAFGSKLMFKATKMGESLSLKSFSPCNQKTPFSGVTVRYGLIQGMKEWKEDMGLTLR